MTYLTKQENTVVSFVSSIAFKTGFAPRDSKVLGLAVAQSLDILDYQEQFEHKLETMSVDVDGESVKINLAEMFKATGLMDDDFKKLRAAMEVEEGGYAPAATVERKKGYSSLHNPEGNSDLLKEAIHILEDTKYHVSESMLNLARNVMKHALKDNKEGLKFKMLKDQLYVLTGSRQLVDAGNTPVVSEFFADKRGRMYQACHAGPNGQSSDLARALMDLSNVPTDYDVDSVYEHLLAEMHDMGDFTDINKDIVDAVQDPVGFVYKHLDKCDHVDKPWNFVKFAMLVAQLASGNKPYIGVAVGLDAVCSGPQLAALMTDNNTLLAATGFSTKYMEDGELKKTADAYERVVEECEKVGITGLTRSLVKKPFMAVFYGSVEESMLKPDVIPPKVYQALYGSTKSEEERKHIAKGFYQAILTSFGKDLNQVRMMIKNGGVGYVEGEAFAKHDKPLRHTLPDGFQVAMENKVKVDLDNNVTVLKKGNVSAHFKVGSIELSSGDTFKTSEYAYTEFGRTGFVNMIQAVDGLLARLIIKHADRLGADHIISVHDCFRVNVTQFHLLEKAIECAYLELFTESTSIQGNRHFNNLPLSKDILGMYFEGNMEATKEEFKAKAPHFSQFSKGKRRTKFVNGVHLDKAIKNLGKGEGKTYYFAK